jgi:hypothetical protein
MVRVMRSSDGGAGDDLGPPYAGICASPRAAPFPRTRMSSTHATASVRLAHQSAGRKTAGKARRSPARKPRLARPSGCHQWRLPRTPESVPSEKDRGARVYGWLEDLPGVDQRGGEGADRDGGARYHGVLRVQKDDHEALAIEMGHPAPKQGVHVRGPEITGRLGRGSETILLPSSAATRSAEAFASPKPTVPMILCTEHRSRPWRPPRSEIARPRQAPTLAPRWCQGRPIRARPTAPRRTTPPHPPNAGAPSDAAPQRAAHPPRPRRPGRPNRRAPGSLPRPGGPPRGPF